MTQQLLKGEDNRGSIMQMSASVKEDTGNSGQEQQQPNESIKGTGDDNPYMDT